MTRRRRLLLYAGAVVLVLVLGGGAAVDFYAEYHWFRSLDFESRFWKLEAVEGGTWLGLLLAVAAVVGAGTWRTLRIGGPVQIRRKLGDLEIAEAVPEPWVRRGVAGAAVVIGLLVAGPFAETLARQLLFALEAAPWGGEDPVLGRDPRFYVFYLPLLRTVWSVAVATLTWAAIAVGAALLLSGRLRATEQGIRMDAFARRRLVWLGAATLLLTAGHFGLSIYEAIGGGPVGYADVHGEIPARRLLVILSVVTAAALVWAERTRNWGPAVSTAVVLGVLWPTGLLVYPELIQRFRVDPNELELETPYLKAEIEATRRAFELDSIRRTPYEITREAPDAERIRRHTSGLPLWDERPLKATYDQLQGLLAYHVFPDVDPDRYGPPGDQEQVAIGVREFSPARLDASARTWQNLHLRYTHGRGLVVTAVDRATEGGEPRYFVRDLPPTPSPDAPQGLGVEEPKFYFGELTSQYILMPPDSFPEAGPPTGVDLDGLTRRALFAWALNSKNILLRNPGSGAARLSWRREVVDRVANVVPFLLVDPDPYPVLHDGRLTWIVELYSASRRYPLAQPAQERRVNYLRSVAKAVVDGVTGEVSLYALEPDEPLLATYRRVFPDLFRSVDEMPDPLVAHLRYPRAVFRTQARMLRAYHMTEPEEFYQRQDLWSLAREVYDGRPAPVEPYFLLMPFPGRGATGDAGPEEETGSGQGSGEGGPGSGPPGAGAERDQEFLLTVPFTPRNRDNLASFLVARNDRNHYGELWLYELSGERQVFGPRQVEVQIDQDPVISQQLSLWQQRGSRSIRGHILLVPIDGYLLYVEPLFLVAEDREGAAPGLKRIITASGDRVTMGLTLVEALDRLLEGGERAPPLPTLEEGAPAGEAGARPGAGIDPASLPAEMLRRIRELAEQADRALREGDLTRFGRLWDRIRSRLEEAESGSDPAIPEGTGAPPGAGG